MLYVIGVFVLALAGVSYWHYNQNSRLYRQWQKHLDANTAHFLNQFAWVRSAQVIFALVAGLVCILMLHNQGMNESNAGLTTQNSLLLAKLEEMSKAQQDLSKSLQDQQTKIQQALEQVHAVIPVSRIPQVAVSAQAMPPGQPVVDAGDTINSTIADRIDKQAQPVTLRDIYNPEESAGDKQSGMDAIKKRYEGLLVNYLFLKKCGLIDSQDYHTIISTLAREMASINAPGRMENDILTSAQGSYNEMYSKSSCTGPEIKQLQSQYSDYIRTISGNIPAQLVGKTTP